MPLGHIGINVSDLEVSYSYYEALMPYLRYEQFLAHDDQFAIRPSDNKVGTYIFFYPAEDIYHPTFAGLQHLAFIVPTRAEVEQASLAGHQLG